MYTVVQLPRALQLRPLSLYQDAELVHSICGRYERAVAARTLGAGCNHDRLEIGNLHQTSTTDLHTTLPTTFLGPIPVVHSPKSTGPQPQLKTSACVLPVGESNSDLPRSVMTSEHTSRYTNRNWWWLFRCRGADPRGAGVSVGVRHIADEMENRAQGVCHGWTRMHIPGKLDSNR